MYLTVNNERIDDIAAIVHGHKTLNSNAPVSGSTSTTQICVPKGKVALPGSKRLVASRLVSRPAGTPPMAVQLKSVAVKATSASVFLRLGFAVT